MVAPVHYYRYFATFGIGFRLLQPLFIVYTFLAFDLKVYSFNAYDISLTYATILLSSSGFCVTLAS